MSNTSCCNPSVKHPAVANIKAAPTSITFKDLMGGAKVRLGIGRMNYAIEPGLYAVGKPNSHSPVLVSANYKLTFDTLRKNISGLDSWLLILDTKGVNVWCAAGKGTFGTDELVNRIGAVSLSEIVSHKKLILPQLGASGVSAHEVALRTNFNITFGPIRANDIKTFISSGCKATKKMRTVEFTFLNRLLLTPIEFIGALKTALLIFGCLFIINLFATRSFGTADLLIYIAAVLTGTVLTPSLLPFIPGKAFSFKGWLLGLLCTACIAWAYGWFSPSLLLLGAGYMLALPAYSAFLAMNFTGASTYTSPSGVLKEMKIAMPLIVFSILAGIVLILIKTFIG